MIGRFASRLFRANAASIVLIAAESTALNSSYRCSHLYKAGSVPTECVGPQDCASVADICPTETVKGSALCQPIPFRPPIYPIPRRYTHRPEERPGLRART